MTRWFGRLPIHQKLVALALVVTSAALLLSTASLVGLDLLRYRDGTADNTQSLALVIAENTAAAVSSSAPAGPIKAAPNATIGASPPAPRSMTAT